MYISEFYIENFKSFEKVRIHLNERINLLTGGNNTGKSTLLEAISLWHECYEKLLQPAGKATKGFYRLGDYTFGKEAGQYFSYQDINSVRSPSYEDIFHNLDTSKDKNVVLWAKLSGDKEIWIGFRIIAANGDNYMIRLDDYRKFEYTVFNDRSFIKNPENAIKVTFASPVANIAPIEELQHPKKLDFLKQPHTSYLIFRNRLDALNKRNLIDGGSFDKLCEQLSIILFDNPGQIKFSFMEGKGPNIEVRMQVGAEVPKDISLYGSGTLQLIEILLCIHEQKNEVNLVLLDEPDSHIHRQLQARLLKVLDTSENTQVFVTTHNEALIREANPNWIFHLEQSPIKVYYPIQRTKQGNKGLMSSAHTNVIQTLTGKGSGLDFVTALEADVLFMVEGVNDALRIQKILSLKNNDMRKYAYWVMGNVDTIFDQILHYKNVFTEIKNEKTLWEKTVLVFDKDCLTDSQREKLLQSLKAKLKLDKIHIWRSYSFDSIFFSDLALLNKVLTNFIRKIKPDEDLSEIAALLSTEIAALITQKSDPIHLREMENRARGEIGKRNTKFEQLKFTNNSVIEPDYTLKEAITSYIQGCLNEENFHKIMSKEDCERVLTNVFGKYDITFSMEWRNDEPTTFNDVFDTISASTLYADWDFILKL